MMYEEQWRNTNEETVTRDEPAGSGESGRGLSRKRHQNMTGKPQVTELKHKHPQHSDRNILKCLCRCTINN